MKYVKVIFMFLIMVVGCAPSSSIVTSQQQTPLAVDNISTQNFPAVIQPTDNKTEEVNITKNTQILFVRWDKSTDVSQGLMTGLNSCDIYVMDEDGSNSVNLSNNTSMNRGANWSHDKRKIVFGSGRDRAWKFESDIFIMDADGSKVKRITNVNQVGLARGPVYSCPTWSPDGTKIAYSKTYDTCTSLVLAYKYNVFVMNCDGSDEKEIIHSVMSETAVLPQWFPDGKRIAYMYSDAGRYKIGSINVNTGYTDGYDIQINWPMQTGDLPYFSLSPDGTKIAYSNDTSRDYNNLGREIFVFDLNTGVTTQLTNNEYDDDLPCWSADDSKILFARYNWKDRDVNSSGVSTSACDECGLYKMNLDGSNQMKIEGTDTFCSPMQWR